jgi:hypothetical protein
MYHTNSIKPLKFNLPKIPENFAAMDIETFNFNNFQTPLAISLAYNFNKHKLFILDNPKNITVKSMDYLKDKLWFELFQFIKNNYKFFKFIFIHNLGSFDSILNYKALCQIKVPKTVNIIIDHENNFSLLKLYGKLNTVTLHGLILIEFLMYL